MFCLGFKLGMYHSASRLYFVMLYLLILKIKDILVIDAYSIHILL